MHRIKLGLRNILDGFGCLLIAAPIVLVLCSIPVGANMVYNEIRNHQYAEQLYNHPLPPQTELVKQETICYCPPNGGTCDLSFYQTMVTSLERRQIEAYYANVHFPPLRPKPTLAGFNDTHPFIDVILRFDNSIEANGRIQFVASIGEAFYDGGLDPRYSEFDPSCEH